MPRTSWLEINPESGFSLDNIPFGIFSTSSNTTPRLGVAIGTSILDLHKLSTHPSFATLFPFLSSPVPLQAPTLNAFAALGRQTHRSVRSRLQDLLASDTPYPEVLRDDAAACAAMLIPQASATMHLPVEIGDYTDFFVGYHHARHCGIMFRGPEKALEPNYLHLPVGYHGRASSVVVSGTPVKRPRGQFCIPENPLPVQGLSQRLDFELELGCIIGRGNKQGESIDVNEAEEHIFGYVLLNDWSARDVQSWEYVPLGPFNGKNFATSISGWVVLADALEPFRTAPLAPEGKTELEYLREAQKESVFDIALEVTLKGKDTDTTTIITQVSSKNLLWSFPQMVTHHTVGGCPLRAGDLVGSGTISGTTESSRGSLLELSEAGKRDVPLADGNVRRFLEDGDTVTLRGVCVGKDGVRVGFGDCEGRIVG